MKEKTVCWNITSNCNENCEFCYRIICNKENTYEQNKRILDILINLKIDRITWSGGECLLYPNLIDLMKEAHNNNIQNNIITNGKALTPALIDEIEEYTDYITFSLDALNEEVNTYLGRGKNHGKHVIELLDYLKNKKIKVKLNSIVTKKNIDNIREVIDIVKRYKIQRWKLFKFISLRGKSLENKNEFYIEDEKYEKLINEIRKEQISCPIVECKEKDIENNYLLIDPIGNFIITVDSKDKIICNLENEKKEEIEGILRNEFRRKLGSI